ncbi:MAG: aspartate aminotransferase family protein, partial [Acidimicrobiales bacterium]
AWRSELHPFHLSSTDRSPDEGPLRSLRVLTGIGLEEARAAFEEMALDTVDAGALPYGPLPTPELLRRRRATLGPALLTYDEPVHLRSGQGVWLHGADGRRYLDAYNNVPVAGHCHPAVVTAVAAQLRRLNTNSRYLHEASVALAERLLPTHAGLDRMLLVNSGSEANEIARRIAAFVTGGQGAVVTAHAYHGVTEATTDLSPEDWPDGFSPAHTGLVPAPPASRVDLERVVAGLGSPLGATFVDCTFTSDGILGPAPEYLHDLHAATRAAGGLFVADEVQAGYGRTGAHLWSYAACGIEPDLVTLGKPMGNGYPVAAVVGRSEHVDRFMRATGYFSTFGGNQGAAVAALAVLRVIEQEGLVAHAAEVGAHLRRRLDAVAGESGQVVAVRSWGLLAGVQLAGPAAPAAEALRRRGILVGTTGPADDVLKIRPPLVFEAGHADLLVDALGEVLAST